MTASWTRETDSKTNGLSCRAQRGGSSTLQSTLAQGLGRQTVGLLKRYVYVENPDEPRTIQARVTSQVLTLDETLRASSPALL
jgi:hypothetical protein